MLINNASLFEKDNIKFLTLKYLTKHININMKTPLFLSETLKSNTKRNNGIIKQILADKELI